MPSPRRSLHVVETAKNGALATPRRDVDAIIDALQDEGRIVLHFHGGLVNAAAGRRISDNLQGTYEDAGAYPVFFVWHSGLLEVIRGNLKKIVEEDVFKLIEKWVAKFVVGKVLQEPGTRGLAPSAPSDNDVLRKLAVRTEGTEPYQELQIPEGLAELTQQEQDEFARAVAGDGEVQIVTASIIDSILREDEVATSRGIEVARRRSSKTLISAEVVAEFEQEAAGAAEGQKGIVSGALLARKAAQILVRVVQRFGRRNDHGIYPTIFEEILREFYLGNVGAHIWAAMKGQTKETFDAGAPTRGGRYFMSRLGDVIRAGRRPEVTLVGHSTGAVFIDNLLRHVEAMREDPTEPLPADFRFKNLVFLAPACTFEDFASVVERNSTLFDRFRMFTMTDAAECKDWLLSFVYPRSLLYFVSSVLETESDGSSSPAKPLVGLNRYYQAAASGEAPAVALVRSFVAGDGTRVVWSPASYGDGLASGAISHSAFDDDHQVRASLSYLISHA